MDSQPSLPRPDISFVTTSTPPTPSPSLVSPFIIDSSPPTPPPQAHKRSASGRKPAVKASQGDGTKPKQSKSRNGCITCKAKRLKCDETKPTCQQCHRRNVPCGGYHKAFKWRPLEGSSFTGNPRRAAGTAKISSRRSTAVTGIDASLTTAYDAVSLPTPPQTAGFADGQSASTGPLDIYYPSTNVPFSSTSSQAPMQPLSDERSSVSGPFATQHPSANPPPNTSLGTMSPASRSGQSPRLIDLLLPGTDMHTPPADLPDYRSSRAESYEPTPLHALTPVSASVKEEEIEEVPRRQDLNPAPWTASYTSTAMLNTPLTPTSLRSFLGGIPAQPSLSPNSTEQLMLRFDKQTCGILSIKDGPTENPWRTLVWPMAIETPALYHAVASLTAFHTSKELPTLKMDGVEHMRRSVRELAKNIGRMRIDAALATTLVLAFSESWDQHISTGIQHLRGAKLLVNQALVRHRSNQPMPGVDLETLRFLVNTWIYMDVIARLTSTDNDNFDDFDSFVTFGQGLFTVRPELDPLMGSASTLFPCIGRVANLIRRVRKCQVNSSAIVERARALQVELIEWKAPFHFEAPEDPTTAIDDSIQTAEAYRWATLLYLHQAVPEIPSMSSKELAAKALSSLACVPLSSRAIIVHIYPLLAAGCEVDDEETRQWVRHRWTAMAQRMWIGNIDRCWEVIKEVWDRRDARRLSSTDIIQMEAFGMDPEETVRGRLHWVGVMRDWHWEVLLG